MSHSLHHFNGLQCGNGPYHLPIYPKHSGEGVVPRNGKGRSSKFRSEFGKICFIDSFLILFCLVETNKELFSISLSTPVRWIPHTTSFTLKTGDLSLFVLREGIGTVGGGPSKIRTGTNVKYLGPQGHLISPRTDLCLQCS